MDFEEHLEACWSGTNSDMAVEISKDQLARLELQIEIGYLPPVVYWSDEDQAGRALTVIG